MRWPKGLNSYNYNYMTSLKIIACVEDPVAIEKILKHLKQKAVSDNTAQRPPSRAPPQMALFEHS